jgi:hypothetical protein
VTILAFSAAQTRIKIKVEPFNILHSTFASQYLPNKHRDGAKLFPCLYDFKRSSSKMFYRRSRKVAAVAVVWHTQN